MSGPFGELKQISRYRIESVGLADSIHFDLRGANADVFFLFRVRSGRELLGHFDSCNTLIFAQTVVDLSFLENHISVDIVSEWVTLQALAVQIGKYGRR